MTTQLEQQLQQMEAESQTAVTKGQAVLEKAQAQINLHQARLDKIKNWRKGTVELNKVEQDRRELEDALSRLKAQQTGLQAQLAQFATSEPAQSAAGGVAAIEELETTLTTELVAPDDHFVLNMEESSEEQPANLELEVATSPVEAVREEVLAGNNGHLPDRPFP